MSTKVSRGLTPFRWNATRTRYVADVRQKPYSSKRSSSVGRFMRGPPAWPAVDDTAAPSTLLTEVDEGRQAARELLAPMVHEPEAPCQARQRRAHAHQA